jgi:hypothetical protein
LVEIDIDRNSLGDDIIIAWISTDFEEMEIIYSILADEEKEIDALFYLSNDNVENMPSIINIFFGNGYIYE